MRNRILGAVILGAIAVSATAQTTLDPQIPPRRDAVPTFSPPASHPAWSAQQRGNHVLGASQLVQPTILPAKGLGLPPGSAGGASAPLPPPRLLGSGPNPVVQPSPAGGPPLIDDLAGPGRSQPLMQGFPGLGPDDSDWASIDTATGYDYVTAVTPDELATYDKAGNELYRVDSHTFFGINTTFTLRDPKVVFDPWGARWVMTYTKIKDATEEASIIIAVTESHQPFGVGGGWYYDMNTVQTGALGKAHANFVTLGYGNDYLTLGAQMQYFSATSLWSRIWVLDKASAYAGTTLGVLHGYNLTCPDGSPAPKPCAVEMQAAWSEGSNIDGLWINSRESSDSKLTLWKIKGAFASNTLTSADINVNSYVSPPYAKQPNGSGLWCMGLEMTSAVATTDTLGSNGVELFTAFNKDRSGTVGCNLVKIDPVANTREWEWNFGSPGLDYYNPRVAADYSGSAYWVFTRSGDVTGYYPEARYVDYDQGVFSNSSALLRDGDSNFSGWIWGLYSGAQMDWGDFSANNSIPGQPSKIWMYGQHTDSTDWNTYIGATSVWTQGDLMWVNPNTTWYIDGPVGGPFTPPTRNYTLMHSGVVGTAYEVTHLPSWLDASPSQGMLYASDAVVQLSVNSTANSMTPGTYIDSVVFESVFNGGSSLSRPVQLTVNGTGIAYCTGEVGDGTPCPCSNNNDGSLPDAGCANGVFASGAKLNATGTASVSNDTVQLVATHVHPSNSGLFFQADNAVNGGNGTVFGDGLRCAGGGLIRLQVRFASSSGTAQTSVAVANKGGVSAGDTKRYQYWYRDTSGGQPCGVGVNDFNLTNGLQITWGT